MSYAAHIAAIRSYFGSIGEDVQAKAEEIRRIDGIAHGRALHLAAESVAHDNGTVSKEQALALYRSLVG